MLMMMMMLMIQGEDDDDNLLLREVALGTKDLDNIPAKQL